AEMKKPALGDQGGLSATRVESTFLFDGLEVVGGLLSGAAVGHDIELDLLALRQIAQAGALDGADVDEGVLAAVVGLNESEAFGGVEPLNGSRRHGNTFHET